MRQCCCTVCTTFDSNCHTACALQESQQSLSDTIEAQPTNDQRAVILGMDRDDFTYIHFPLFCGADLRVYRQKFAKVDYSEPESLPRKVHVLPLTVLCLYSASSFKSF